MNVAEYIASELARRGVKYVFGIPGGPSIPYMEEFSKKGIDFVLTSNETSAGIMADVWGRLSGIPGVCHATFGPGATNLSTGVGGALLDRSPMLAFTTEVPLAMSRRTVQMNIDHHLLFEPLTKASIRMNPDSAAEIISDAFDLALSEYPGPVHIGLPSDISSEPVKSDKAGYISEDWDQETIIDSEIAALLEYSKKPLIAVGLGAKRNGMKTELLRFLDTHNIPVLVTPMAKGIVPENHPCFAGVLFHALSTHLQPLIDEADLVIGFGYDPVEYNYESWVPDVPIVHINSVKTDMPCDIMSKQVTGSLEGILDMISSVVNHKTDWSVAYIKSIRNSILTKKDGKTDKFGPLDVLRSLEKRLSENSVITIDVGSHIHFFGQFWETYKSGEMIMSNGWSGMGFAIPAALSAKLYSPDKEVFALLGDGCFLMSAGEIITARRLGIKIVILVLSDGELNLIKLKQEKAESPHNSINLYEGSLFNSEEFLGVQVISVSDNTEMDKAMTIASKAKESIIIDARICSDSYSDFVIV